MAVHLYTATGAVLAFLLVLAAINHDVVLALWLNGVAVLIDGTDGFLARRFRVSERVPWFDGRRLDDIVDYLTYVFVPVILLWNGGYLPPGPAGMILAAFPLLASSYQFCRVDAKTDDHFFLGFPSYWNVIAFYAILSHWDTITLSVVLVVCSILVFVPIRYVYPTRTVTLMPVTLALTFLWGVSCVIALIQMPHPEPIFIYFSYIYVVYYVALSLYLTLSRWERRHGIREP